ncbi:AAA family ATPase [Kocuria sp. SM24M-10]|uniref:AAA family ATPase n=1 Tax=Kocuria sp. SM24M-10 TaxID=1660349 RepID=UPI0019393742|nr:AAA family ATPase [Kocuria sp. SM24M-10]
MNYRSVIDSTQFEVESDKTIMVGVNEAGKTAILKALRHIKPPVVDPGTDRVNISILEDYPRRLLNQIQTKQLDPSDVEVVRATFILDAGDLAALPKALGVKSGATFTVYRFLDNDQQYSWTGFPQPDDFGTLISDVKRLRAYLAKGVQGAERVVAALEDMESWPMEEPLSAKNEETFARTIREAETLVDEDNTKELARWKRLHQASGTVTLLNKASGILLERLPLMVYYSTYFTVRPRIDLESLAARQARGDLDREYDFGNLCLLRLLGFSAQELSDLAKGAPVKSPRYDIDRGAQDAYTEALKVYQARLDDRHYRLNAASLSLTQDIRRVWGDENVTLRLVADGQYLKVMVVDDLGVEIELDQRSEGFRWLVSFFVVFRAQAQNELAGAILLLDEPGLSLHALKQQEFRRTVSLLGEDNQIIYTTHSPFMVGPDELHRVRIVEMADRTQGTKVHTRLQVDDPKSVYPLQAALGYELAQSMFSQKRNLVVEGVTDMFYLNAVNGAAQEAGGPILRYDPAIVPAGTASKVAYFCTIYATQNLAVAALLDSDTAGDDAAAQDALVSLLPKKSILRVGDFRDAAPKKAEVEDLFRETLTLVAKGLGWDSEATVAAQPARPLMNILDQEHGRKETGGKKVSKWKLVKAFSLWLQDNGYDALSEAERAAWEELTKAVNKAL